MISADFHELGTSFSKFFYPNFTPPIPIYCNEDQKKKGEKNKFILESESLCWNHLGVFM